MSGLCVYQNILGKPGEGFHSTRIGGFALFDILGTFLLAFLITKYSKLKFLPVLLIVFIIAEICHYIFCVPTTFMKLLLGNEN